MRKNVSNLVGTNIYLDRYGDAVYYNIFNKNGYVIPKSEDQRFRVLYNRYSIIFIVLILLGDYFSSLQSTLLVGIGVIVLTEAFFRGIYLNKLKVIKNFKREKKTSILEQTINSKEKEKIIMKAFAYVFLSILLVINAIQQNFNAVFLILSCLVAMYSFYSAIINTVAFIKIKRCM